MPDNAMQNGTTLGFSSKYIAVSAAILSALLAVGTGGIADASAISIDCGTCYDALGSKPARDISLLLAPVESMSTPIQLATIRANFRISVVEVASILEVSRQTFYDWISERQTPNIDNRRIIDRLYMSSLIWSNATVENQSTTRRKFDDKGPLLELLKRNDVSFEETAYSIKQLGLARNLVPKDNESIVSLTQRYSFKSASSERQNRALRSAGW